MFKSVPAALAAITLAASAHAASITVETNNWTEDRSPAVNSLSGGDWSTGGTSASRGGNQTASLISDFGVSGDFTYTGTMRATADDDIMGIVFGWTDNANHYRMGWEGGGYNDSGTSSQDGFWLIRETGGTDVVLANTTGLYWSLNTTYNFSVSRTGNQLSYSITNGSSSVTAGSVFDNTYTSGKVGVYQESNYSAFTNLAVTTGSATVPVPAALPMLMAGLGGLAMLRRRG